VAFQLFVDVLSFYIKTLPKHKAKREDVYFGELADSFGLLRKPQEAVKYITENLSLFEKHSNTIEEYGAHLLSLGYAKEACALYEAFLQKWPNRSGALNNLAIAYKRLGRVDIAEKIFAHIISLDDKYASAWSNLAIIFQNQKKYAQAQVCLEKSIALEPDVLQHYAALAECLRVQNELQRALQLHLYCVKKFPNEYDTHLLFGNFFAYTKQYAKAVEAYRKAISIDDRRTQAHGNIGVAYKELGELDKAEHHYKIVLNKNPNDPAANNNMGNLMRHLGRYDEAISHLQKSIEINPRYADAYGNLGALYKELKLYDKAIPFYENAIKLEPQHINANFDMALIRLSDGDYVGGFEQYEYRLKMAELLTKTSIYKTPIWNGEPLDGKTIVLQNEQGFGDNIMFVRYAKVLKKLGAKVIVRSRPHLLELFACADGVDAVCCEDDAQIPEHDYYIPMMSCAVVLKTTTKTIPSVFPYISIKSDTFKSKLDADVLNVGIVWSLSRTTKDFKDRYVGLERFGEILKQKGVVWHSLQIGEDSADIERLGFGGTIIDHSSELTDFAKTAMLICELDLVITTDTSVAHLCGALDKEAWVIIPKPANWRWTQNGDKTPWYRSLKLFRQQKVDDWSTPMEKIAKSLASLVKKNTSGKH